MTASSELQRLVSAERRAAPAPGNAARGFARLEQAIAEGAAPLALGSVTAPLLGGTFTAKVGAALLIGASVGGLTIAHWEHTRSPERSAAPAVRPLPRSSSLPRPAHAAHEPSAPTGTEPASTAASAPLLRTLPRSRSTGLASAPARVASTPEASTLQAELELVRAAKAALDAGNVAEANSWLEQHASRFPGGLLSLERDALRVLCRCANDPGMARVSARAFVRDHAGSPFVDRVRRACGLEQEEIDK